MEPSRQQTVFMGRSVAIDRSDVPHFLRTDGFGVESSNPSNSAMDCDGYDNGGVHLGTGDGNSSQEQIEAQGTQQLGKSRRGLHPPAETGLRRSARIAKLQEAQDQSKPTPSDTAPSTPPKTRGARTTKGPATSDQKWEVEKIVGSRICADTYEQSYEVKWKGFPKEYNTWEPKINLGGCRKAIAEFERRTKQK